MKELIKLSHLYQNVKVKNKIKTILTNVNISINEGDFIAIVGCSGAGKTTLMRILGGYNNPSSGKVLIDNYDMFENKEYFKGKIAYVPQEEILDNSLSLYKALQYSLELRVRNIKKEKINSIINNVLDTLELSHVRNVLVKNLSGGERKRASIATEMLSNPSIFLLDEPTSGLDANIEKKVMRKLREIADSGKTVVITAHTISNLNLCDKIIFMGKDGKICYYGPYKDAVNYFGVKEFVDIYDLLKDDTDKWYKLFNSYIKDKDIVINDEKPEEGKKQAGFFKQISIFVRRYASSLWNNKLMLSLFLGQALLMALLVCFALKKDSLLDPRFSTMICAAFTFASMYLGLFNTIQEIVKERDILKKEYMSGLNYASYIISKIIIFSILCFYQSLVCVIIIYFYIDPRPSEALVFTPCIDMIIQFFLITFSQSAVGLFISSIVKDSKTTLIISPLYMMIQILFSGIFIPFLNITEKISYFIISRWGYEGFGSIFNLSSRGVIEFTNGGFSFTLNHILLVWFIILVSALTILTLSIFLIKYSILSKKK